jgi:SH3-like domain-containing protein
MRFICGISVTTICSRISAEISSGKCVPYYMSIKGDNVNARVGPGGNYKVRYIYMVRGLPVIVVAKYDTWYKVIDPDREECWIHKSMLSSRRCVIVTNTTGTRIHERSNDSSAVIAYAKKSVVMELVRIRGNWCEVNVTHAGNRVHGWVNRATVFGITDSEG